MKNKNGWLLAFSLLVGCGAHEQVVYAAPPATAPEAALISKAVMAKAYVNGKPQGITMVFKPKDHMFHCVLNFKKIINVPMKFVWTAVDAGGLKNYKVMENTLAKQRIDTAHAHLSLPRDWPVGKYRVTVYINGKFAKAIDFKVQS